MSEDATVPFETSLHVRDRCLCLHAQRAARVLARRFDEALRPVGLTNTQFSLLMALNRPAPASMRNVATLLGADRTTLTAMMKPLLRRGLATIGADPKDGRIRRIALTAQGRAKLAAALPHWTRTQDALEQTLWETGPTRLRRDLRALAALEGDPPTPAGRGNRENAP